MATDQSGGSGAASLVTRVLKAADGAYKVDVPRGQVAQVQVVDLDLVLVLRDGTRIVLANAAIDAMDARAPAIRFADGANVASPEMLAEAGKVQKVQYAQAPVSSAEQTKKAGGAGEGDADREAPKAPVPKAPTDTMAQQAVEALKSAGQYSEPPTPQVPQQPPPPRDTGQFHTPPSRSSPPVAPSAPAPERPTPTPPRPAEPVEQPPSPAATDGVPVLSMKLVNVAGLTRTAQPGGGELIRGAGGEPNSAVDPSPRAQAQPENIVGTAGADVIRGDANAAREGHFAKVLALSLSGLREVRTVTLRGLPADFAIEGAVQQPDGSWVYTPEPGTSPSELALRVVYPVSDDREAFRFTLSVAVDAVNGEGAAVELAQSTDVLVRDVNSPNDVL